MAEEQEDKNVEETSSPIHYSKQDSENIRLRAKENLKKATQVLAESGEQLMKNKKTDTQTHLQEKVENPKNEKEASNDHE